MEAQKSNNSGLKAIIVILCLLLIGSLGYMFKLSSDSKDTQKILVDEKESVLKDLAIAKDSLDAAIARNTALSDELIVERDKIQQLISDVQQAKENSSSMMKYKDEALKLRVSVNFLMKQVETLKNQNSKLLIERDSTVQKLNEAKKYNDTLVSKNVKLATDVERASKLSVLNLQVSAVRQKSSGKQIETDKASKTNILKISFMIAENQIAKSGDKQYYIQVVDSNNEVLGDMQSVVFSGKTLIYSFVSTVKYENKTVKVEKNLTVTDIKEGGYYVNVFDKDELVSRTSFNLK
ncbi:MAG: hypothetical protein QM535_14580 [Limnohabitans sp.]|nr:hypothetical protein [Limnohabitans sp.]